MPEIDIQNFGYGVFYRDRSYHSNAMTSLVFLLTVDFLKSGNFLSKLSTVLVV